ncbi:MAG: hypothetical protein AAF492_18065 [Verrucomicrobiota bacterium]
MISASHGLAHSGSSGVRIDQKTVIRIEALKMTVEYALTANRPAAYREVLKIDVDRNGVMSEEEQTNFFTRMHAQLAKGLELHIDDKEVSLTPAGSVQLSMPFTKTYRYEVTWPKPPDGVRRIEYHNENYLDFRGDVSVDVEPGEAFDVRYYEEAEPPPVQEVVQPALVDLQERDLVFEVVRGSGRQEMIPLATAPRSPTAFAAPEGWRVKGMALLVAFVMTGAPLVFLAGRRRQWPIPVSAIGSAAVLMVGTLIVIQWADRPLTLRLPSPVEARLIFERLHGNIYQAFHADGEEEIYDVLAESLAGDLLDEIYNEVYQAGALRKTGVSSFNIRRVKPMNSHVLILDAAATEFRVRHRWQVYGTVSHFQHKHTRINEYEADYTVADCDGRWRITEVRVKQQNRIEPEAI